MSKRKKSTINQIIICKNCLKEFSSLDSRFKEFCSNKCLSSYAGKHVKNRKGNFKYGHTAWNKGLTKETDERLLKTSITMKENLESR